MSSIPNQQQQQEQQQQNSNTNNGAATGTNNGEDHTAADAAATAATAAAAAAAAGETTSNVRDSLSPDDIQSLRAIGSQNDSEFYGDSIFDIEDLEHHVLVSEKTFGTEPTANREPLSRHVPATVATVATVATTARSNGDSTSLLMREKQAAMSSYNTTWDALTTETNIIPSQQFRTSKMQGNEEMVVIMDNYQDEENTTAVSQSSSGLSTKHVVPSGASRPGAYRMGHQHQQEGGATANDDDVNYAEYDAEHGCVPQQHQQQHQTRSYLERQETEATAMVNNDHDFDDTVASFNSNRMESLAPPHREQLTESAEEATVDPSDDPDMTVIKWKQRKRRIMLGGGLSFVIIVIVVGIIIGALLRKNNNSDSDSTDELSIGRAPTSSPSKVPIMPTLSWLPFGTLEAPLQDSQRTSYQFGSRVKVSGDGRIVVAVSAGNQRGTADYFPYLQVYSLRQSSIDSSNVNVGSSLLERWIPRGQRMTFKLGTPQVSISYDGTILVVGVQQLGGRASIYQWKEDDTTETVEDKDGSWIQLGQELSGVGLASAFGTATDISNDGSVIAVSDPAQSNLLGMENAGCVHLLKYDAAFDTWALLGQEICGERANERVGHAISFSGDGTTIAFTIRNHNSEAAHPADVRIYSYITTLTDGEIIWVQRGQSINAAGAPIDEQTFDIGHPISLSHDGMVVAVGDADFAERYSGYGSISIFRFHSKSQKSEGGIIDTGQWVKRGQTIRSTSRFDRLGWSVSLSYNGTIVVAGAPSIFEPNLKGSAYVYQFDSNNSDLWAVLGHRLESNAIDSLFGFGVSLSADGSILMISDPQNSRDGLDSGSVYLYQLA